MAKKGLLVLILEVVTIGGIFAEKIQGSGELLPNYGVNKVTYDDVANANVGDYFFELKTDKKIIVGEADIEFAKAYSTNGSKKGDSPIKAMSSEDEMLSALSPDALKFYNKNKQAAISGLQKFMILKKKASFYSALADDKITEDEYTYAVLNKVGQGAVGAIAFGDDNFILFDPVDGLQLAIIDEWTAVWNSTKKAFVDSSIVYNWVV